MSDLQAPLPWSKVHLEETAGQITFAHCHLSGDGLLDSLHVSRRVVFDFQAHSVSSKAAVYIRGKKLKEGVVRNAQDAEALLREVSTCAVGAG